MMKDHTMMIILALMAVIAVMQERDNHPFNDVKYVLVEHK